VIIGIDARFLTHPQCGGFKTYTSSLVEALATTSEENKYIIYTDRRQMPIELPINFTVRPLVCRNSIIREQLVLPFAMHVDKVDLAHFPCNTAPVSLRPRMAITIHDTIPLQDTHLYGNRKSDWKGRMLASYWRTALRRGAQRADLVITDSDYSRSKLDLYMKLSAEKVHIVRPAVRPVFFSHSSGNMPSDLCYGSLFLLAFASQDGRKNHEGVLRAYREVRRHFSNIQLVVVCSHQRVRSELLEHKTEGVIPVGPVFVAELVWLYKNALALVFPSFDEGFGLPPLEAMASGTPVVASKTGSLPEVLNNSAIFVDPFDTRNIAEGIEMVLRDDQLRNQLSEKGREHASAFTYDRMGQELVNVYSKIAG